MSSLQAASQSSAATGSRVAPAGTACTGDIVTLRLPAPRQAVRRSATVAWPVLQSAAAATIAWIIADLISGHDTPFFAPIAAVVALNASIGERGRNALRLLLGVGIGIVAGELALGVLGSGAVSLGVGTFVAMLVVRAADGARVVMAQAAAGAILTVATGEHIGIERFLDALIGAAVALTFTQLLFSPEPMALLRRAETTVLAEMATALALTGRALRTDDAAVGEVALARHRALRDGLVELARMRAASVRTARHSVVWRSSVEDLVQERENAGHLDLLAASALMVTRTALAAGGAGHGRLAPSIEELADILGGLARGLGDRKARQAAAGRALALLPDIDAVGARAGSARAAAVAALQAVITDVLIVAGVPPADAATAVREGLRALKVEKPPTPSGPFRWLRLLPQRFVRWLLRR